MNFFDPLLDLVASVFSGQSDTPSGVSNPTDEPGPFNDFGRLADFQSAAEHDSLFSSSMSDPFKNDSYM